MAVGFPVKDDYATGDVLTAANMNDFAGTLNTVPTTIGVYAAAKNKIINGDAAIAQRGTSIASVTTNNYLVDRFELNLTTMGTWTVSQESDAPAGFAKSLKALVTTADASPAASDRARIMYKNEGNAVQSFSYGNASAKTVTISFWVKSNVTGTYVLELFNIASGTSRHIASTYSVSASATWEKKSITFTGDTATAIVADNAERLSLIWYLGAGSDFTSGTLATSWANNVSANRAVGQTNLVGAINNYFQITGVQMEIGSVATPFQTATGTLQGELAACQRYYYRQTAAQVYSTFSTYSPATSTTVVDGVVPLPVTMRTIPTSVDSASVAANDNVNSPFTGGTITITGSSNTTNTLAIRYTHGSAALTQYRSYALIANNTTAAYLGFSAEL
jgi:hypothetical protein